MNPKNKILFAGDPHGDFRPLIAVVHEYKPEAVVLLGDYDLEMPLENYLQEIIGLTEIWWIAGNHDFETPSKHKNLFHSALAEQRIAPESYGNSRGENCRIRRYFSWQGLVSASAA